MPLHLTILAKLAALQIFWHLHIRQHGVVTEYNVLRMSHNRMWGLQTDIS